MEGVGLRSLFHQVLELLSLLSFAKLQRLTKKAMAVAAPEASSHVHCDIRTFGRSSRPVRAALSEVLRPYCGGGVLDIDGMGLCFVCLLACLFFDFYALSQNFEIFFIVPTENL